MSRKNAENPPRRFTKAISDAARGLQTSNASVMSREEWGGGGVFQNKGPIVPNDLLCGYGLSVQGDIPIAYPRRSPFPPMLKVLALEFYNEVSIPSPFICPRSKLYVARFIPVGDGYVNTCALIIFVR